MSRGNDAIPSWSGFTYQGKLSLLVALELINKNFDIIEEFHLEIEKTEDFVVFQNDIAQAFYQVKAYPTKQLLSAYTQTKGKETKNAFDKLLLHKNETKKKDKKAKCLFCVVREITNWNDATNVYKSQIELYKYNNNFVGLLTVIEYIKKELDILKKQLKIGLPVDALYRALCEFITDKVLIMHSQLPNKRQYNIPLQDIVEVIKAAEDKANDHLNEKIYLHIADAIEKRTVLYCVECGGAGVDGTDYSITCNNCGVTAYYEALIGLGDISEFCKIINPSQPDWKDVLNYSEYMNRENIADYLYPVAKEGHPLFPIICEDNNIYLDTKMPDGCKLVPTLLRLANSSIQRRLQTVSTNEAILPALNNNAITASLDDNTKSLLENQPIRNTAITYISHKNDTYDENDRINPGGVNIRVLDSNEAISYFMEKEGVQHDG